jgi:peptidoglycan/xylan/chitin deacetylase (PgdA/CDA1 family)
VLNKFYPFVLLSPYFKWNNTGFFLFGHGVSNQIPINSDIQDLHIELKYFSKMIDLWEKMGFVFLSMEEAMEIVIHHKKPKHPWIHLTFDDGYKNNFTILYPYLKARNIPFTIFLSTKNIINQERFDNYKINCSLFHTKNIKERNKLLGLPDTTSSNDINFSTISAFVKKYKYQTISEKIATLDLIENLLPTKEWDYYNELYNTEDILSHEDIKVMSKDPLVHLGSHGHNHYILSTLSESQINFEQSESRKIISSLINRNPITYCYPNGKINDLPTNIVSFMKNNHYDIGFTTVQKKPSKNNDPYFVPRFPISYNYIPKLFLKLL